MCRQTGSPLYDACWHLLFEIDPIARLARRTEQRIYLARYARQDIFSWDKRTVAELDEYYEETSKLIQREQATTHDPKLE